MATIRPCDEVGQDGLTVRIEQTAPTVFQLTLGALELASLIAAARWVAGGVHDEPSPHSVAQLRRVLACYDEQWRRI